MTISVFMFWGSKVDPDPNKRRRHKNVRTKILCRMVRSRGPQISWDHFRDHFCVYVLGPKVDPDPQKLGHHKSVRTEILCRMLQSRGPLLSRGLFSRQILYLCLGATFGLLTDILLARSTFDERDWAQCVWDLPLTRSTSNESTFTEIYFYREIQGHRRDLLLTRSTFSEIYF